MFAREPLPDVNAMTEPEREKFIWREFLEDSLLTAFHEAGHAVACYLLGYLCIRIEMHDDGQSEVILSRKFISRVNATLHRKRLLTAWPKHLIDNGILTCAGPAAELRICKQHNMRIRQRDSTRGDHEIIETITKAPTTCNLNRWDFQNRVWREAETMIATAAPWKGVTALAGELDLRDWGETITGKQVHSILRQAGLQPGVYSYDDHDCP